MITSVHGFPTLEGGRQLTANSRPVQEVETFEPAKVNQLSIIVQHIILGSQAMVDFLQYDRELAREAGVESLCVEISGILEGDKFDRVVDTIEEAVQNNTAVTLSRDGLARIRRIESLLAEAQNNISRFTPGGILTKFTQERRAGVRQVPGELGQNNLGATNQAPSLASMIFLGAIAVTLIVYASTTD